MLHGPQKLVTLPNSFYCLALVAAMYILAAHIHVGSTLRGLTDSKLRQGYENQGGEESQESLHHAIASLEQEHKRLQDLVQQSETLIRMDKDLTVSPSSSAKPSVEQMKRLAGGVVDQKSNLAPKVVIQHSHSIDPKRETVSKKTVIVKNKPTRDALGSSNNNPPSNVVVKNKETMDAAKPVSIQNEVKGRDHAESEVFVGEGLQSNSYVLDSTVLGPSQGKESKETRAMMVVCGTDGSGTRSVVQTLTRLGVLMTSEDPETYDIHGDLMGGWPTVVKPVIATTRSLDYDPKKINPMVHNRVLGGLRRLVAQAERDSHRPESFKLAVGGALKRTTNADATRVQFGFKAPVAMTLAPYWAYLAPKFKLLHVLRDGRDIAFSANQGPVQKFYNDMYGGGAKNMNNDVTHNNPRIKAIRLWSDWNTQLRSWSEQRASSVRNTGTSDTTSSFSYMSFHTEDLVSSNVQVRYRAISDLAEWVGSTLNQEAVCCIAQEGATFMGSHDRTSRGQIRNQAKEISKRYGKWRGLVARDRGLQESFETVGGAALRLFGYEQQQIPSTQTNIAIRGYLCPNEPTPASAERCSTIFPGYAKT